VLALVEVLVILVNTAFGNKITTAELVQKQLGKFFDGNVPPSYRENALKLQVATRTPVAGTGVKPQDTLAIRLLWKTTLTLVIEQLIFKLNAVTVLKQLTHCLVL
jgi:hypothetical protein